MKPIILILILCILSCNAASIIFTQVPILGSTIDLKGIAIGCTTNCKVAVYIYVSSWWTKPTFGSPSTTINADGTWECDITTGPADVQATRIAAFLLPISATIPIANAAKVLPKALETTSLARNETTRGLLEWCGHSWEIKNSTTTKIAPGPNYWSNRPSDVWVDVNGALNLASRHYDGRWWSSEVTNMDYLGYGRYMFELASPVKDIDPNIVLGAFTYDSYGGGDDQNTYRELDFEFSKWGNAGDLTNAQTVVQPHTIAGNRIRFTVAGNSTNVTCIMDWISDGVTFHVLDEGELIYTHHYTTRLTPGYASWRFNLWQYQGQAPSSGTESVVKLRRFGFTAFLPTPTPIVSSSGISIPCLFVSLMSLFINYT